ncbi:D-alanyl-D-alanine carboxypeptidase family protein [Erysipelothrix urinaevulpis]|uniref:D-alanyl-D-alanine carboxypeptidase family protein n=1 Tax=Erysipelothrix urinaevulpis TaxID=2683717 RepID=UPI00135723F5|nr:hypothetical protein [Erysipelothrix urinaevulpis]
MKRISLLIISFIIFLSFTPGIVLAESDDIIPLDEQGISSKHYILYDPLTKTVLSQALSHEKIAPASITKALTLITALELIDQDPSSIEIKVPAAVYDGLTPIASIAGFEIDEVITLEDAFYGLMLPSGADASRIISWYLTQSPEGLASEMNKKAQAIGMKNSLFMNTSGLDQDNHYSTAYDLALLIDYALQNEDFKTIYDAENYTTSKTSHHPEGIKLVDRNLEYARKDKNNYILGAKSGYTENAQRSLSSYAQKDNKQLIFISTYNTNKLASENGPVEDANLAYARAFEDYKNITILSKNTVFDTLAIENAKAFEYLSSEDINIYIPKDLDPNDIKIEIKDQPHNLVAPVEANTSMGNLEISYNDKVVYRTPYTNQDLIPVRLLSVIWDFSKVLFIIISLALFIVFAFLYIHSTVQKYKHFNR